MFGVYFGKYLEGKGILTQEEYMSIIKDNKIARVKMGLLAVETGYMTQRQADEVNFLQQMNDRRFGDIAIEKGYLTHEQVESLLKHQGDDYLLFVQALVEREVLTLEEIQNEVNAYKKAERFTALDLDAIKSGDVDKIVQVFIKDPAMSPDVKDYIALISRNIVRFIDSHFRVESVERVNEYTATYLAAQELDGDYKMFTGFGGDADGLRVIAEIYGKEDFPVINEDALDSICEFLNCNNGLFATKLGNEDINLDMLPPIMQDKMVTIRSEGNMFKIPIFVLGKRVDLIICIESKWIIS